MQGLALLLNTSDNDVGEFSRKVFVKVSDYPGVKVLTNALFSSSLLIIYLAWHHIILMEIIAICITKKTALLYKEIRFLTSFSSRHNHMFLKFCI